MLRALDSQTKIWRADELGSAEGFCAAAANYSYDVHPTQACFALSRKERFAQDARGGIRCAGRRSICDRMPKQT